jgi:hypothetical protein
MLQKLFKIIFIFLSSKINNLYVFTFIIVFGRTCYGTPVLAPQSRIHPFVTLDLNYE